MKKYIVLIAAVITLALILVIGQQSEQKEQPTPVAHPVPSADGIKFDYDGVVTPADGTSIADLYAQKSTLAGKEVIVSGKVVKFTPNVMGTNWVHLRDGSGEEGTNDLTVNTNTVVKVGDTITIHGIITLDKDLGFGYKYDILIENAEVTVE